MPLFKFRRLSNREPLPVAMSGVRMGERVLQVGVCDADLAGVIAAKVGLSGHAAIAVTTEDLAVRARAGAADAGGLADVQVTPLQALPFDDEAFDVVVIDSQNDWLAGTGEAERSGILRQVYRVVRRGGRVVLMEQGERSGMGAWLHRGSEPKPEYAAHGGAVGVLQLAGFRPVRLLADREGYRFTEGLKG